MRDSENQQEFRSYRQALLFLYAGFLSLGSLLVLTSIVVELFFKRAEPAPEPTPADLVSCNDDVRALLEALTRTSAEIQGLALSDANLGARWEDFASGWRREWVAVKDACQFDTLADSGLGSAFDTMADVHAKLPVLQLSYREMIRRWADTEVPRMREMRHSLERSRKSLQERSETPPPEKPDAG